jgi:AraC-like DNA-binding protein
MGGRLLKIQAWEHLAVRADFKAATMASLCNISDRQLQRFFKQRFNKSPSCWLRELQCNKAKQLILRGYSSKAAANELKFASQSHFCREFKRQFGLPPQMFSPMTETK